ncbi:protein STICHEL-like [Chenopodium quinoa]|uniref:protein STICHEL-like n=1 Tax=Chenopodium quinoa TaxID=63459 RepID=UPI000B77506E|nr:protein STICHEL-like [Chenopodium quinoa]
MSGSSRLYDPSKLHLKRELTQIRKAARVLRDPGTTSSWKSPLSSSRSVAPSFFNVSNDNNSLHFLYHNTNGNGNNHEHLTARNDDNVVVSPHFKQRVEGNNDNDGVEREMDKAKAKEKDRRVFLYNWRSNRSLSEKSLGRFDLEGGVGGNVRKNDDDNNEYVNDGSSVHGSVVSDSVGDSLSDARNAGGDSKSDTCIGDHHRRGGRHQRNYSTTFRCRDTRLASMASPTRVRRVVGKKKSRKGASSVVLRHQLQKQTQKRPLGVGDKNSKWALNGGPSTRLVLNQDDSVSLIDQSDGTEDYCASDELRQVSGESPLLSRLKKKHRLLRGSRRDDSSYTLSTPALSTSSFNRFMLANCKNPSTVGSWDGTTTSFNDVDDNEEDHIDLPGRQGCGIPCYWSKKTPKHKGDCRSCYSPSISDTLRRKGGKLLCGSQKDNHKQPGSLSWSKKQKIHSQMAKGHLPLLSNSCDGGGESSFGTVNSDDELSTNFGELNLEGLSRLDGRRWSASYRSQDGSDFIAASGEGEEESSSENIRSLSQRYRPIFFDELIGQNIVVQSLMNSISKGRVAPVYLFQGPRGTGKTSSAKIFAAALNCLATEGTKPCGICRDCSDFISGRSKDLVEVDGSNNKAVDRVRHLLKSLLTAPSSASQRYKILLIDECHMLPSKTWSAFLKFLEDPLPRVVFIFVTTDLENVPRTVLSRCQKYLFNKIKDGDIVSRLRNIAAEENLEVDSDALDLIALNADGSLRDAETMLDQLSLLGKRITTALVNELVGVISDDKLLELLELAMSSNTAETVKRARELMDSGIDPLVLMSQLASLIMDIIAGSYQLADAKCSNSSLSGRSLSESELEKLKHALKLLSESEKQLRVSSERSTWFTATLLQLGSVTSPEFTLSGSSKKQSSKTTDEDPSTASRDASGRKHNSDSMYMTRRSASPPLFSGEGNRKSGYPEGSYLLTGGGSSNSKATHKRSVNSMDSTASHGDFIGGSMIVGQANMDGLDDLWLQCIERCHSKTLRQLLHCHGRLLSIAEVEGVLIVYIAFRDKVVKSRAERFLISITNSIEMVLERSIEVRMILLPEGEMYLGSTETVGSLEFSGQKQIKSGAGVNMKEGEGFASLNGGSNSSLLLEERSSSILDQPNENNTNVRRQEVPMQRIESIIREQRLESAWLQAAERSTPRSMSRLRPEKNQVLPQEGIINELPVNSKDLTSNHWDDELNHEIKALKITDRKAQQKDQDGKRIDHHPISPSLLHQSGYASNLSKDYPGYESGPGTAGCNMLFCWNTRHPRKGKGNQGNPVQPRKGGRFLCFGECKKSRQSRAER